jgi:hypothetical protein
MRRAQLPSSVRPRAFNLRQAAAFWGVSANTFRKFVRLGIAPPPLYIPELGRDLFDIQQQDQAIRALRREKALA